MATKRDGVASFDKADLDEPVFCLRAQDRTAPATVRDWAQRAKNMGASEEKVSSAMDVASAMDVWQSANGAKTPD